MNGIAVTTEVGITTVNEEAISDAGAVMRIPTPIRPINVEHALGFVKLEQVVIFERHALIPLAECPLLRMRIYLLSRGQLENCRRGLKPRCAESFVYWSRAVDPSIAGAPITQNNGRAYSKIENVFGFRISSVFHEIVRWPLTSGDDATVRCATKFADCWGTAQDYSWPVLLMPLDIGNAHTYRSNDRSENRAPCNYLIRIQPSPWWRRGFGASALVAGAIILYAGLIVFASHEISG